jgi:hypothetical protein
MVVLTLARRAFDPWFLLTLLAAAAGCGGHSDRETAPTEDASADASPDTGVGPMAEAGPPAYVAVELSACVPSAYTAAITLGGTQQFQVAIDTGSTTLGVASNMCTACGVTPLYDPGPTAVYEHQSIAAEYGTGSWTGELYQDSVAMGSEKAVPVRFGAIDMQSQFFIPVMCDSKSGGLQGIIGFAPAATAIPGTNGFFDQLVATDKVPNIFATELCDTTGTLWLGGYDPTFTTAAPQYTSLTASQFSQYVYAIQLTTIEVAGTSVPVAADGFTDAIVDTGTSVFVLSSSAFSALTNAIASSPMFTSIFGMGAAWFSSTNNCRTLSQTKDELDAALPPLTLTVGADPPISIQALPTESYLISYEGLWCPALDAMDPSEAFPFVSVLGSPVLRSNIVIFDRAQQRIGFAPHKTCS